MKKSSIITIALIVCLVLLAGGAFSFFGWNVGFGFGAYANAEKYRAGDTEITSPVENLEVVWTEGTVNIEFHSGSGVTISETAKKALTDDTRLHWWLDGTTLRIQYAKSGLRITGNLDKTLTVSLPEGLVLGTAVIRGTSADLNISALAAEDMTLASTSGDIRALVAAKKLKGSSTSGNIDLKQRGGSESVIVEATSGNVTASVEDAKDVRVSSTSGSVALTQSGDADSVKADTTSGNISAENVKAGKAEFSSTSGDINVRLNAFHTLAVSSTSGAVTAALPANPGFACKVSTASGSFNSDLALVKNGNTYTCGDASGNAEIKTTSGNIRLLEVK